MMTIVEFLMIGSGLLFIGIKAMSLFIKDKGTRAVTYVSSTRAYITATGMTDDHINKCMAAGQAYLDSKKNK
jgi:3-methyladenine DNA glycosylase Tag